MKKDTRDEFPIIVKKRGATVKIYDKRRWRSSFGTWSISFNRCDTAPRPSGLAQFVGNRESKMRISPVRSRARVSA